MYRKTYVEIDLGAIRSNLRAVKGLISDRTQILLPVKADAYGHGLIPVSRFAEKERLADMLGVASIDEGIELRRAGITLPVLLLGPILPLRDHAHAVLEYDLTPTLVSYHDTEIVAQAAKDKGARAAVHLKVDTGMGRVGCTPEEAPGLANAISCFDALFLEGVYSHFPVADTGGRTFTEKQIEVFKHVVDTIRAQGIDVPLCHIANSAGIINYPESHLDLVRPGIISYGYLPAPGVVSPVKFIPAMTMHSSISFIKRVPAGCPLSYGHIYTTGEESTIATVTAGYGDGYNRLLSNRVSVLIQGKKYPVVGRVSMDQILVNLGDDRYPPGEDVVLFGKGEVSAAALAEEIGTIPYEITCAIARRVPRLYME